MMKIDHIAMELLKDELGTPKDISIIGVVKENVNHVFNELKENVILTGFFTELKRCTKKLKSVK